MDDPAIKATGQLGSYAYSSEGMHRDRTTADVLKDIMGNVQDIIRSEVRLAKSETQQQISKVGSASKALVIGAVLGLYGAVFILQAVVYALSIVVAPWLASLIVGVLISIPAAILAARGIDEIAHVKPKPEKTIETVKENVEWMKNQTR